MPAPTIKRLSRSALTTVLTTATMTAATATATTIALTTDFNFMTERSFSTGTKRRPYTSASKARSQDLPNFTVLAQLPSTCSRCRAERGCDEHRVIVSYPLNIL